ncbi:MAG: DNA translocase FtsK 4TM domain-containing protein, partial [Bacteroidota bacterium]
MANKAKPKKGAGTESGKLKTEKDQPLPIKNLVKDERTHKITGAVLILLAFFLFVAFTSYLFTWKVDQASIVNKGFSPLFSSGIKTVNLLGNVGALVSYFFFRNGFGIASYLLCTFFFVAGVNLLFAKKMFSLWRNTKYVLTGLIFLSITFAFLTKGSQFPWGGAFGEYVSDLLTQSIGSIGTAALLSVVGLAYIIWRFNPVFKVPKLPERKTLLAETDTEFESDDDEVEGAKLFIDTPPVNGKGNTLKKGPFVVTIPPRETFESYPPLELIERPGDDDVFNGKTVNESFAENSLNGATMPPVSITPVKPEKKEKKPVVDLSLQLNDPVKADEPTNENDTALEIESERKKLAETDLYEPTLDLRDYKYPSLDLLETHGSEKIVQDPGELETNKNRIIETLKNYDIAIQKISATVGP